MLQRLVMHARAFQLMLGTFTAAIFQLLTPHAALADTGSRCIAMAGVPHQNQRVRVIPVAVKSDEVQITYVTHATFRIRTPTGLHIATDYAGFAGQGPVPDIVTMNRAHETHFTYFPDPAIKHVLRGWNPEGGPARHYLKVGETLVRNVPTDIRSWTGDREKDGNSIFIFEVAGLCIGHLGHLHHELAPEDLSHIGQLDVVMAPVDGSFTLDHHAMAKTLKVLKAAIIIPMHAFSDSSLQQFISSMGSEFPVEFSDTPTITVRAAELPRRPKILVLPEASSGLHWD
jgi:L-ascorbate metabolism protein UlaG (beta-lactamase superfamily)